KPPFVVLVGAGTVVLHLLRDVDGDVLAHLGLSVTRLGCIGWGGQAIAIRPILATASPPISTTRPKYPPRSICSRSHGPKCAVIVLSVPGSCPASRNMRSRWSQTSAT